jgi:hypothetical protein
MIIDVFPNALCVYKCAVWVRVVMIVGWCDLETIDESKSSVIVTT